MGDSSRCTTSNNNVSKDVIFSNVENWCFTNVPVVKFNYLWTISNFSYCQDNMGDTIKSAVFSSSNNDKEKWCLRLSPRGPDEESKDFISLYLLLVSCKKSELRAKFRFSLINGKGEEAKSMESHKVYKFVYGKDWGFKKFMKRDLILNEDLMTNDRLTIFCEISVVSETISVFGKYERVTFKVPDCKLQDNLEDLLFTQKFCDVIISANGHDMQAHKAILAARSSVFSAMFIPEKQESQSKPVIVTDLKKEVMREMLRFIYSGKVNNLEKLAYDLLAAADKFDLERLKVMCEEVLCKNLCPDNVVHALILADNHSATQLKSEAITFISANSKAVLDSKSWKTLVKSHPHLIAEAFKFLASHQELVFSPVKRTRCQ